MHPFQSLPPRSSFSSSHVIQWSSNPAPSQCRPVQPNTPRSRSIHHRARARKARILITCQPLCKYTCIGLAQSPQGKPPKKRGKPKRTHQATRFVSSSLGHHAHPFRFSQLVNPEDPDGAFWLCCLVNSLLFRALLATLPAEAALCAASRCCVNGLSL